MERFKREKCRALRLLLTAAAAVLIMSVSCMNVFAEPETAEASQQTEMSQQTESVQQTEAVEQTEAAQQTETAGAADEDPMSAEERKTAEEGNAAAAEAAAAAADLPEAEVEIEYTPAEGEVIVEPDVIWEEGVRNGNSVTTAFHLTYRITNRSNMMIPETELVFRLPEDSGFLFQGEPQITDGGTDRAMVSAEGAELMLSVKEFGVGESLQIAADGTESRADAEESAADGEAPGQTAAEPQTAAAAEQGAQTPAVSEQEAEGPEAQEQELPSPGDITARLTLRGYGLEHVTNGRFRIPGHEIPAPVPERKTFIRRLLVVNLTDSGFYPEEDALKEGRISLQSVDAVSVENASRSFRFLTPEEAGTEEKGNRKIPLWVSVLIGVLVGTVFGFIATKIEIFRAERKRIFQLR